MKQQSSIITYHIDSEDRRHFRKLIRFADLRIKTVSFLLRRADILLLSRVHRSLLNSGLTDGLTPPRVVDPAEPLRSSRCHSPPRSHPLQSGSVKTCSRQTLISVSALLFKISPGVTLLKDGEVLDQKWPYIKGIVHPN